MLVGAAGLSIMTGVAYYRSWSKKIDRLALATPQSTMPPAGAAAPSPLGHGCGKHATDKEPKC
ncbi:MAG: hypothetical protein E6614_15760, partial [Bradyrhizobium sp.]|nr:hypothetical protein [Bradyrhizobium sp.]